MNRHLNNWFSKKFKVDSFFNPNAIPNDISRQGNIKGLLSDIFVMFFNISNIKYKLIVKEEIRPNMHKNINAASKKKKKVPNSIYLTEI